MRAAALLAAALSLAAPTASGQAVIVGGAGFVYGGYVPYAYGAYIPYAYGGYVPYAYGGYVPYVYGGYGPYVIVDPWAAAPLIPRSPDTWPSCYRYGRCSPADVAVYRYRVDRLERLAPSAPVDAPAQDLLRPSGPPPPPTAEQEIRPEYLGASVLREAYRESGRPLDGRP